MVEQQERRLGDVQNDIHQVADSLPGLWKALASNLTVAITEANQTELGEWQVPGSEEEPSHILGDEWGGETGRPIPQRPPPQSPPGEAVCSQRACVNTCICCRVSRQILGASATAPHQHLPARTS